MATWVKDASHWLHKFTPDEWIRAAMRELRSAEASYKQQNGSAGLAGCRRAAGMALNAALIVEPNEAWKRTYVEHLRAVAEDTTVPAAVSEACRRLLEASPPNGVLVSLRSPAAVTSLIEATRDVMAHAYAVVARHDGKNE